MKIRYIKYNDIDLAAWDTCIAESFNGNAYAYSWFLNAVCDDWDALVAGSYEYVMPITWRRKFGIYYLYQPFLTQQLGVFTNDHLTQKIISEFLYSIPKRFKFIEISLNTHNLIEPKGFEYRLRTTYKLDLNLPYKKLFNNFNKNVRKNVRSAENKKITVSNSVSIQQFINFLSNSTLKEKDFFSLQSLKLIRRLISNAVAHSSGIMQGAYDEMNLLCGVAFFIRTHNKAILLLSALNETGRKQRAMYAIINHFIKENSGKSITLDFEGSEIEEIAYFYRGFNAIPCKYQYLKKNNLPAVMKYFKH